MGYTWFAAIPCPNLNSGTYQPQSRTDALGHSAMKAGLWQYTRLNSEV